MAKVVDDRSPMAKAMSKVSEIMAICLMMIVPALIGYLIDQRLALGFVFTVLGLIFGMTGAVVQLMRLVSVSDGTVDKAHSEGSSESPLEEEIEVKEEG